jgi:hypothetical protein
LAGVILSQEQKKPSGACFEQKNLLSDHCAEKTLYTHLVPQVADDHRSSQAKDIISWKYLNLFEKKSYSSSTTKLVTLQRGYNMVTLVEYGDIGRLIVDFLHSKNYF